MVGSPSSILNVFRYQKRLVAPMRQWSDFTLGNNHLILVTYLEER